MTLDTHDIERFLTDEEMRRRLGIDKMVRQLQFVMLGDLLFRPVDGGWEAYVEDDDGP